jgi:hypothetical protein
MSLSFSVVVVGLLATPEPPPQAERVAEAKANEPVETGGECNTRLGVSALFKSLIFGLMRSVIPV